MKSSPAKRKPGTRRKRTSGRKTVFSTPWFQVLEAPARNGGSPHYAIQSADFAVVVALTSKGDLLLVRQFRHAVGGMTLELPAGHVEKGETPEQAARKELLEETGYAAKNLTLVAKLSPSTARFTNRTWCFFAANAKPSADAAACREAGIDLVLYRGGLKKLLDEPEFYGAGSCAALFAALVRGKLNRLRKSL
jgi:ADP-ribose pyrophosphatase